MITRRIFRPASALKPSSWICPSCTRTSILPRIQPQRQQQRYKHDVPLLGFEDAFQAEGVPGLFAPQGYQLAWTEYQGHIIQKLNDLVAGEPIENLSTKDLILSFARDPMNAAVFNHASMAFNNHFFFGALSTQPIELAKAPQMVESLVKTFGSIETLRATMIDTAASMFGPGFVWLVWARNVDAAGKLSSRSGQWRILNTYLAGTPFPEAGYRQQGVDMNNNNPNSYQGYLNAQSQIPANTAGAFGPHSQQGRGQAKIPPGGTSLVPVLCVNTWEHVYLYDYGVAGKRKYLEDWWDAVDWGIVQERAPTEARTSVAFERAY
ncbi:putative 37S ribosomal protein S26A, mitochondrial [Pseudocercospora fuligena]|uniref:Putative 37S ribosomal protein S26A, mitochondrial n=1 Tax=Pseudocercospora fuligena TaxID=685502 RepID=A0A8H6RQB9_9PEZI|nr:putative 37S ribosomal protein S26A, mitochondrial [Pseudocercospora fuligena]